MLGVIKEYTQYHMDGETSDNEDRIGGLIRAWEIFRDSKLKEKADDILAEELIPQKNSSWPFQTAAHFRFVSNTSVSLLHYLYSTSPEDHAKLQAAIIKAADSLEPEAVSSWGEIHYPPIIIAALAYQFTGDQRYANLIACLLQRIPVPRDLSVAPDFLQKMRTSSFEQMLQTVQQWNVNNVYIATIHNLVPLPYAIAALQKAKMSEQAVWSVERKTQLPPAFEEVIAPAAITKEMGLCYVATLANGAPSDMAGVYSDLVLLENGKPLQQAHSSHTDVRTIGKGHWSHWGSRSVYFSTSDNTDPRTNGREYKVVFNPGK
jgi:hypothetical protein